jgi:hypothetical protein
MASIEHIEDIWPHFGDHIYCIINLLQYAQALLWNSWLAFCHVVAATQGQ